MKLTLPKLPKLTAPSIDKQAHFWAGLALYGICITIMSPISAIVPVAIASIGKEFYDKRTHTPDWKDSAATMLGGLAGLSWNLILTLF